MTTKLSALMEELSAEDLAEVQRRSRGYLKAMADASRLDETHHDRSGGLSQRSRRELASARE